MSLSLLIAGIVILLLLAGWMLVSASFYRMAIARSPEALEALAKKDEMFATSVLADDEDQAWWKAQPFEKLMITTRDHLRLAGYFLPSRSGSLDTLILFHGYRSNASSMAVFARLFHDQLGCNILAPEARGHGGSQGHAVGMGWAERGDVARWVYEAQKKVGPYARITLFGVSMGGATVMMAAGEDLPDGVKCIIEDCGYDNVSHEFRYQLKRMYHLPAFPLLYGTSLVNKIRSGFFFEEASSIAQLKKARLPVLFIHGAGDDFVPVWMAQACYQACASPKKLWIVTGAGHAESIWKDPRGYCEQVTVWMRDHAGLVL